MVSNSTSGAGKGVRVQILTKFPVARPAGSKNRRALIVFKHGSKLDKAPSHKHLEGVTVTKNEGVEVPRAFADYTVTIPGEPRQFCQFGQENGIEIIERL